MTPYNQAVIVTQLSLSGCENGDFLPPSMVIIILVVEHF